MVFEGKNINDIKKQDLLDLIDIAHEDQTIDFKQDAYQVSDKVDPNKRSDLIQKKRIALCTDISTFANASGGWIICGMDEKEGFASDLTGLTVNAEEAISDIEKIAKAGIEPYPYGLSTRPILLQDDKVALVIHIPRSYNAPHRVKETSKFYVRRSNRNDEMTMDELRNQFTFAASFRERARAFRKERVDVISVLDHEDMPIVLDAGIHIVLHVIPITAYETQKYIDLSDFNVNNRIPWVRDLGLYNGRYNVDGYVNIIGRNNFQTVISGYNQIYRNGIIECVRRMDMQYEQISLTTIEGIAINQYKFAITIQKYLVRLPILIALSLTNAKGRILLSGRSGIVERSSAQVPLNKTNVLLPDVFLEEADELNGDERIIMRPIFDMLWNIGDYDRSLNYDTSGKYIGAS